MPELTEEELRRYQTLESTVSSMLKNPKAGLLLEQAHKLVDEKAPTPRLDAQRFDEEQGRAREDRIVALEKQIADDKAAAERREHLSAIQTKHDRGIEKLRQHGWTDTGIDGVKKIMEEQGILDVDVAAAYFEKIHPPQAPVTPGGSGAWNFMEMPSEGADDLKRLIETRGESTPLLDKMVRDGLQEARTTSSRR